MTDNRTDAPPPSAIRRADERDLKTVVDLIRAGDERSYADDNVARFIAGLDPAHAIAWLAEVQGKPVGLSMLYRRELRMSDRVFNSGYWANLYIDPGYRNLMLYPRLPMAMFDAVKRGELDFIYALVRRQQVLEAHTKIGVAKLGELRVMVRPLRPIRFITRFKNLPGVIGALGAPIDVTYAMLTGLLTEPRLSGSGPNPISAISWHSTDVDKLADLLNGASADRIAQSWTADRLRRRFTTSLDGDPYVALAAMRDGVMNAAAIFRTQQREYGLKVGVVMSITHAPGREDAAAALLREAHVRCHAAGADAMLFLDGQGPATRALMRSAGYFDSPQRFTLMLWPKKLLDADPSLADPSNWQLSFADHDAF